MNDKKVVKLKIKHKIILKSKKKNKTVICPTTRKK